MSHSNRPLLAPLVLLGAAALAAGCARSKTPATPPSTPPIAAPAPVAPESPPPTPSDAVESPLDGDLVAAQEHAYATGLLGDVHFDFDRAELREEARDRLTRNARFLRERPEFVLRVEGHCDERGTNEYNLALGERRAQAVRDYLIGLGIDGGRLRPLSYGEERPQCAESGEGCWARNRRAHFVIVERR